MLKKQHHSVIPYVNIDLLALVINQANMDAYHISYSYITNMVSSKCTTIQINHTIFIFMKLKVLSNVIECYTSNVKIKIEITSMHVSSIEYPKTNIPWRYLNLTVFQFVNFMQQAYYDHNKESMYLQIDPLFHQWQMTRCRGFKV